MTTETSLRFDVRDGEPWVVLAGEIDYAIASDGAISDDTIRLCHVPGRDFTVDMSGVTFIDPVGVSLLLRLRRHGGTPAIRLVNVPARALRVFTAMGLTDVLVAD